MAEIRLPRLPSHTPVRQVISLTPDQHKLLVEYAAFYAAEHGEAVALADLLPAMLDGFARATRLS